MVLSPLLSGERMANSRESGQSSQTREDAATPRVGLTRACPALSILEPKWRVAVSPGCPLDLPGNLKTCPHPGSATNEIAIPGAGAVFAFPN